MSAVQNDTLKINHCVNRAAPVSIYRDWPASLSRTRYRLVIGTPTAGVLLHWVIISRRWERTGADPGGGPAGPAPPSSAKKKKRGERERKEKKKKRGKRKRDI